MKKALGVSLFVLCGASAWAAQAGDPAQAELDALSARVKRFRVVALPAGPGELILKADDSLTIEDLRGVPLDDDPPALGKRPGEYAANMQDGFPEGQAPYVAKGIAPFRLREFTCEFSYGGWHNFNLFEYSATHGFRILAPYVLRPAEKEPFSKGTQWLKWGGFLEWKDFLEKCDIPWGRWDKLAGTDPVQKILDSGVVWKPEPDTICMIDIEQAVALAPEELRKQEWYPKDGSEPERESFEAKYYEGYAMHHTALAQAARKAGWKSVGLYPQLFGRGWFEMLGKPAEEKDPAKDWQWMRLGRRTVAAQDVLYPDLYVYYWSAQNVGYVLAHLDYLHDCLRTLPNEQRKPIRPYFWPLLHGGGADYRWWNQMPLPTEEERALFAMALFTGVDGLVLWNWSDVHSHHRPREIKKAKQTTCAGQTQEELWPVIQLKDGFTLAPKTPEGGQPTVFRRYDAIAVTDVNAQGGVSFQHFPTAVPNAWANKRDAKKPTYAMPKEQLVPRLRAESEPVAGAIEGLALVKPLEYIIRHGEVRRDVPSVERFVKGLPLVRRVRLGRLHVLVTYNPQVVHGGGAAEIALANFDGREGRTLRLPADEQTRIFVLRESE